MCGLLGRSELSPRRTGWRQKVPRVCDVIVLHVAVSRSRYKYESLTLPFFESRIGELQQCEQQR